MNVAHTANATTDIPRMNPHLTAMLSEAHAHGCCLHPTDARERSLVARHVKRGAILRTYRGLYDDASWASKDPHEQSRILARTLWVLHPDWLAADVTAADFQGLEHGRWQHDGTLYIRDDNHNSGKRHVAGPQLRRIPMPEVETERRDGVLMPVREATVVTMVSRRRFLDVLPVVDSAVRSGMSVEQLMECAERLGCLTDYVRWVLGQADGNAENGGESCVRGVIIAMGFQVPHSQVVFRRGDLVVRVDWLWELPDGNAVVLELDGNDKYVDPAMTRGNSTAKVVVSQYDRDELLRDCGVHTIIHTLFEEAWKGEPLRAKLIKGGVPFVGVPFMLAKQPCGRPRRW